MTSASTSSEADRLADATGSGREGGWPTSAWLGRLVRALAGRVGTSGRVYAMEGPGDPLAALGQRVARGRFGNADVIEAESPNETQTLNN